MPRDSDRLWPGLRLRDRSSTMGLVAGLISLTLLVSSCAGAVGRRSSLGLPPAQAGTPGIGQATGSAQPSIQSPGVGQQGTNGGIGSGAASPGQQSQGTGPYRGEIGVTKEAVTIGLFRGKTGAFAALQTNGDQGFQTAFNEANETGGVHGRKILSKSYDDGSLNPSVIDANWRVAKNEVLAVFGQEGTYFMPHADRDGVPLLFATGLMASGRASRYGFPLFPYIEYQAGSIMPGYMLRRLNAAGKRVAVMYDSYPANSSARAAFKSAAVKAGLNIVIEQPVENLPSTCVNQVSNVQAKNPDIVLLLIQTPAAICVFRDARSLGFRPTWTGVAGTFSTDVIHAASGGATEGVITFGHVRTLETSCGKKFQASAAKYYPNSPGVASDGLAYLLYLAGRRFVAHLRAAGPNVTRESLVKTIEASSNLDDGCLSPPIYTRGDHRGPLGVCLFQARDERWVTIDPVWRRAF